MMTRTIFLIVVAALAAMQIGGAFGRAVHAAEHMESVR